MAAGPLVGMVAVQSISEQGRCLGGRSRMAGASGRGGFAGGRAALSVGGGRVRGRVRGQGVWAGGVGPAQSAGGGRRVWVGRGIARGRSRVVGSHVCWWLWRRRRRTQMLLSHHRLRRPMLRLTNHVGLATMYIDCLVCLVCLVRLVCFVWTVRGARDGWRNAGGRQRDGEVGSLCRL